MRFLEIKFAMWEVLLPVTQFSPVSIILPLLRTHLNLRLLYLNYKQRDKLTVIAPSLKYRMFVKAVYYMAPKHGDLQKIIKDGWKLQRWMP